jgi:hypothetical protein
MILHWAYSLLLYSLTTDDMIDHIRGTHAHVLQSGTLQACVAMLS